jgi:hypothetical protein
MCEYQVGDIVEVFDKIDPENQPTVIATVKYIEPDNEFKDLYWIYLIANEDALNVTDIHPVIGPYWAIFEHCNPYVKLISKATVQ